MKSKALALCVVVLLAGCGPVLPVLEPKGPPITAGSYDVCLNVQLVETQEDATWMCRQIMPFHPESVACATFKGEVPQIIVPVPRDVNDWERQTMLGHEVLHTIFEDWHQ
jgi:uncharacterized protein YceK